MDGHLDYTMQYYFIFFGSSMAIWLLTVAGWLAITPDECRSIPSNILCLLVGWLCLSLNNHASRKKVVPR